MEPPPVHYTRTPDGYDIAYTVSGEGLPLVLLPYIFNHVELNWRHPAFRALFEALSARFRLILYDSRGQGMSTRGLGLGHCLADYARDLDAVLEQVGVKQFVLMGRGAYGHIAVHFAAAHPDRVQALVLESCSVSIDSWPAANTSLIPGHSWELILRGLVTSGPPNPWGDLMLQIAKEAVTQSDWEVRAQAFTGSSLEDVLHRLAVPTLVLHRRDFILVSAEEGMKLASRIPSSRLVMLAAPFPAEPEEAMRAIDDFLRDHAIAATTVDLQGYEEALSRGLSSRETQVLRLVATGKSNRQIADELVITLSTVQHHVGSILGKTESANRTEAAAYAHRHGLV